MTFIVPPPIATLDFTMSDGAAIRVRRHGNVEGPRIVLSHGNGFAIDAYYPFWRYLLPDFDVIVYDQRNHGQNPFPPIWSYPNDRWPTTWRRSSGLSKPSSADGRPSELSIRFQRQ